MQHEEKANIRSSESDVTPKETVIVKKTGSALGLLAILIALGLGGAGYYFGQQQVDEMQQKLTALQTQLQQKMWLSLSIYRTLMRKKASWRS